MSFGLDSHRRSDRITITHYVSPHLLWFKYEDSQMQIPEIQHEIESLTVAKLKNFNYTPSIGEIVIVHYCFGAIDKLIRARVDSEYKYRQGSEFILWAIDEGYPIRSSSKFIMKLPSQCKHCTKDNPYVFKATLNQVVPATVQFNILELEQQIIKTKSWSEKAINQVEKILSDAESLIFHYDCRAGQQHLFGSIEVISCTGKSVRLSQVLKDLEEAVECTANFEREYNLLIHKNYWDQQQENYKIKENGGSFIPPPDVKALTPTNVKQINIVDKMNDWDKRNKRSLSRNDKEQETLPQAMQKCNITENVPHSKRYEIATQKREFNTAKPVPSTSVSYRNNNSARLMPSTSVKCTDNYSPKTIRSSPVKFTNECNTGNISTSSYESFHSAEAVSFNEPKSPPNLQFKKALQRESFCIIQEVNVLMHCPEGLTVQSISSAKEANFSEEVHKELQSMRLTDLYRTQAVGWPHLMRGHSMILVNSAKSGKTLTYLPAICSLLGEAHADDTIVESDGPVMLIICLNSTEVDKVKQHCSKLLKGNICNYKFSCKAAYGHRDDKSIQSHLLNGIDILVTTIPCLLRLMANPLNLFNKNRITTIVFDEIDSMCETFGFNDINSVYKAFLTDTKIQFVVTSKTWHNVLKKFAQKNDVLICIGAYIEAAIYSGVEITVHSIIKDRHNDLLLSCIKSKNYIHESIVVICNNAKEVLEIVNILQCEAISTTFCHEKSDSSKIAAIKKQINQKCHLGVLVCVDDVLLDLNIRYCQHIIHYSLPSNWTYFTRRFIASFDYYENLVKDTLKAGRPTAVIFVDENSLDSFPRLIEFMKTRCFAKVPKHTLELAEKKRIEREECRLDKYNAFCDNLLTNGVCHTQYTCNSRHILTKIDRPRDSIPRNGCIKFSIIAVHTPVHYSVRLLEHRPLTSNKWQKIPFADDYFTFQMEFKKYFNEEGNRIIHYPHVLDDLCVIGEDNNEYKRCKIIGIDTVRSKLTLLLIDTNDTTICKPNELMILPLRFKDFPPQAVHIRISGLAPSSDTKWDKKSTQNVKEWFNVTTNYHIEGAIDMAMMDCIWVKNVQIKEKLTSINEEATLCFVNKKLIKEKIAVADLKGMEMLREMANKMGLFDTQSPMPAIKQHAVNAQQHAVNAQQHAVNAQQHAVNAQQHAVNAQQHDVNAQQHAVNAQQRGRRGKLVVHSSNESIHSQTNLIASRLSKEIKDISLNSSNGYLTTSESEGTTSPNYQTLLSSSGLSESSRVCRERWASLDIGKFSKVDIGEFYSPDRFYVMLYNGWNSFRSFKEKINKFTTNENLKPLAEVTVGQNCLSNYKIKDDYRRAKILSTQQIEDQIVVNLFLLDFGVTEYDVPLSYVIEIPTKFIEGLPFQAILCKLLGIRPPNNCDRWSTESLDKIYQILSESSDLYFQPVKESANNDGTECNSYDGVYAADIGNINQFIVNEELAEFDPETRHLADIFVDFDALQKAHSDEEDWDDDNENVFDARSSLNRSNDESQLNGFQFGSDIDVNFDEEDVMEMLGLPRTARILDNNDLPIFPSNPDVVKEAKKVEKRSPGPLIKQKKKLVKSDNHLNQLHHPAKMPYITWEQTDNTIALTISAPDVKDYFLKVGLRYIHFCFMIENERYENILNLYGCINVEYTSHEIRGLNILVRLMKTIPDVSWPRLVRSPDKNRYLKYKLDRVEEDSESNESVIERAPNNTYSDSTPNDDDDFNISDFEV